MIKGNVVIIGAGRSGRGYLGELFFLEQYQITFADIDSHLISKMKDRKKFISFKDKGDGNFEEILIHGFESIDTLKEHNQYIEALSKANFIFTATFSDAFDQLIEDIRESIHVRIKEKKVNQVCFILGANYIGLFDYFDKAINERFNKIELDYFNSYIVMVESIIYRISSFPSEIQKKKDELSIQNEDYNVIRVNEKQISKYRELELPKFFLMEEDTTRYMHLKIWKGNTMHCSLAFMGNYFGLENICDSANNDYISKHAYYAYQEAYKGLAEEYNLGEDDLVTLEEFWSYYRDVNFKDSNLRVGNDPIRKLARNDRFIGPALVCIKHGILPIHICQNAAYGFYFKNEEDVRTRRMQEIIQEKGIETVICEVTQLNIQDKKEKIIYDLILSKYYDLVDSNPVDLLLSKN